MLVCEKGPFIRGSLLLLSFAAVFCALLVPMSILNDEKGTPRTGLQYADNVFNELSKGSSYFIPAVREQAKKFDGTTVNLTINLKKADLAPLALTLLQKAGVAQAKAEGGKISFEGNLGKVLLAAVEDSDRLYHNDAATVSSRYEGASALKAAAAWWYLLSPCIKEMQKQKLIKEAQAVDQVVRRAVEPGNNFFSVAPSKVSDHVVLMAAMLIFYVLYTLWYGFSIFELFEGMGLTMTKSKVKQER
ncbi:MAG: hypothetical protein LBC94_06260 [Desulfovibrio sp.]|jgi:hypothetical protein|nr:hypothetical protein [Desulfovibrio sp.]